MGLIFLGQYRTFVNSSAVICTIPKFFVVGDRKLEDNTAFLQENNAGKYNTNGGSH